MQFHEVKHTAENVGDIPFAKQRSVPIKPFKREGGILMDCIFCKIANHEIPSTIVYENDYVIAFNDLNPVAPVHVLVIPKKHMDSIMAVDDYNYVVEIHKAIKEIAKICKIEETGFRVISNVGEDGGQSVKHLHYHVIGGTKLPEKLA